MGGFCSIFDKISSNKMGVVFASAFNVCLFCISVLAWLTIYLGFVPSINEQNMLSNKLENSISTLEALQGNFDDVKRQKSTLNDVNNRLRTDIENLNSQLKVKDETIDNLKNQLKACTIRYSICSEQLDKANHIAVVLTKRNSILQKEREEYGNELLQRRKDVEDLLNELNEMQLKFSNYSENPDVSSRKFEETTETILVPVIESTESQNRTWMNRTWDQDTNSTDVLTEEH